MKDSALSCEDTDAKGKQRLSNLGSKASTEIQPIIWCDLTKAGVAKDAYEGFFAKNETSSYLGYKWKMVDNNVYIYDLADTPHEGASSAFDLVLIEESNRGG